MFITLFPAGLQPIPMYFIRHLLEHRQSTFDYVCYGTDLCFSFEFFMWPSYMRNITPPLLCLKHFSDLYGRQVPIRIGGTTQDRATYDANFDGYVSYHVDDPLDAPMDLLYGPRFFDLISECICRISLVCGSRILMRLQPSLVPRLLLVSYGLAPTLTAQISDGSARCRFQPRTR